MQESSSVEANNKANMNINTIIPGLNIFNTPTNSFFPLNNINIKLINANNYNYCNMNNFNMFYPYMCNLTPTPRINTYQNQIINNMNIINNITNNINHNTNNLINTEKKEKSPNNILNYIYGGQFK
jgi:hypothetical protein